MDAKLIKKSENYYELYEVRTNLTLLIGSTDFERKIYVYGKDAHKLLSLKNCQAIELGYDLDELEQLAQKDIHNLKPINPHPTSFFAGYRRGFQKALEILGDKKFSEDDMKKALEFDKFENEFNNKFYESQESFIQSLQQTEWDVWLVMACGLPDGCTEPEVTCTCDIIPSLDADGCLILKRKSW